MQHGFHSLQYLRAGSGWRCNDRMLGLRNSSYLHSAWLRLGLLHCRPILFSQQHLRVSWFRMLRRFFRDRLHNLHVCLHLLPDHRCEHLHQLPRHGRSRHLQLHCGLDLHCVRCLRRRNQLRRLHCEYRYLHRRWYHHLLRHLHPPGHRLRR